MFLNSIKQQQNSMSQLCNKEPGILFALQRNQEWGNFPYIGLNIVPVPKPFPSYSEMKARISTCFAVCFFTKFHI